MLASSRFRLFAIAALASLAAVSAANADEPPSVPAMICAMPWDCAQAILIATCESSLDPTASNGYQDGLFAIDYATHGEKVDWVRERLKDAATNIRVAFDIYSEAGGWSGPWRGCLFALG